MSDLARTLVDTHCHLTLPDFKEDLDQVLENAWRSGLERIVVPGIDLETSRAAVALAESHPGLYAAVGVHPHHSDDWTPATAQALRALAASAKVVAIGEAGLDYYRDYAPRDAQRRALRCQLELAAEAGLPIILHNREASDDLLPLLAEWTEGLPEPLASRPGVLHAFSGDLSTASQTIEMGFYLGIAGPLTYKQAASLRSVVRAIARDRTLIETDAPYLPPHPHRGQRNEPAYVSLVAERLATEWETTPEDSAAITSRNAGAIFGWDHGIENGHLL